LYKALNKPLCRLFLQEVIVVRAGGIFKRLGEGEYKNHDLYQLLSYCTVSGATRGGLIYPRHLVTVASELEVRRSPITIEQRTLALDGTVTELRAASANLAAALVALSKN
jgi:hypothetical protein